MNMLKKSLFSVLFITAGLHAAAGSLQQNLQVAAEQKTVALQMIEAMQGSVNFYQQAQKPLDAAGIKEQQSAWQSAVGLYHRYINDLRGQSKVARPALANLQNLPNFDALMLQSNQSKALFTRLLDEYIAHLGNVYEKKSNLLRFYRNVYVIASADDQNLSITPNEYLALVQTLENAAQQGDWGTTVNISLPVIQADGSIVEKNLTLNEIKAAIQEIPLPASYYATALKVAAGVALAAFVTAYFTQDPNAPAPTLSPSEKAKLLSLLLATGGTYAASRLMDADRNMKQNSLQVTSEQKTFALQMIEAMEGSVNFYQQAQQPLDTAGIKEQQSAWQSAVGLYHRYINDLRGQSKVARPALANLQNLPNIDALMLQSNQSKALFARLLDEYIAHLGNVYEKKSNLLRLYRNVYVISSSDDQNLSITPNEYLALVQTLENAAQQGDWGTTVNLTLPVIQADGSIVEKNLTLNQIKAAIQEIPLPASYYARALKIATDVAVGVAIGGAINVGAYVAYDAASGLNRALSIF